MISVEKKRNFIINVVYTVLVVTIFYFFMKYAFGMFFPFLCALVAAMFLQKPVNYICKKTPIPRGIVSVSLVLLTVILFLSLLVLVGFRIGVELKGFFDYIMIQLEDIPAFIHRVSEIVSNGLAFLPDKLESSITGFVGEKLAVVLNSPDKPEGASLGFDFSMLQTPLTGMLNAAKQIPTSLVAVVIAVVACCFMTSDFDTVKRVILSLFRDNTREKIVRAKHLLFPALGKMAKAYGLIVTITFTELALGLFLLKLLNIYSGGYILIISIIIAIIDIVPILGTGTVLVPWAVYNLIVGDYALAVGIIIMYVCITVIRQIIEPKLVANQLGLPAFATIIAMYVGTRVFGFVGLFLLPLTLVMIKLLNDEGFIHVFHKVGNAAPEADVADEEPKPELTDEKADNE